MNSTTGSEYTENIYIHLKLIFAFAAQSSLSKCVTITYETLFERAGRGPCPAAQQHPCRIHIPVLGTRYSGTVPCPDHDVTVYRQLHIDDAIHCIIDDVMIMLYGIQIIVT